MKLKLLLISGVIIIASACHNQKNDVQKKNVSLKTERPIDLPDSLSSRRISFVLNLKKDVAQSAWSEFSEKRNEGTLIYFDGPTAEVFFPSKYLTEKLDEYKKHSDDYYLIARNDSVPFHMEVMVSFNIADSTQYYYNHPVEQYSSVEEVGKSIPSVESTEMWSTMVIHEMFHHFQYNNQNYQDYAKSEIGNLPFSSRDLISICYEHKDFITMIQRENNFLMQAIAEDEINTRDSIIATYIDNRKSRIKKYSTDYPNLEQVENFYVIQEGSARYIEYKSMFILSEYFNLTDHPVMAEDPMFKSYSEFEIIDLTDPAFSYLTYAARSDYHYTIGFNTMRLLDVLQVDYKSSLLNNPEKGIHQYLEEYLENKK